MPLILVILAFFTFPSMAKSNSEILFERTQLLEKNLLENNKILPSPLLEKKCMDMAKSMLFNQIKQCKIIDSTQINAYVLANGHVYFSVAMMQQIKNEHQWAAILAHENAHLELNHYEKTLIKLQKPGLFFPKLKIKKMMRKHENQADEWSMKHLKKMGYDADQNYFFMQRVIKILGNRRSNSHIKTSKRAKSSNSTELIDAELINVIAELD